MTEPRFLIALDGLAIAARTRIPLVIRGRWAKRRQKFAITDRDIADIVRNFRARPNGEVVIDWEHATLHPEVAAGGPIPAAGWLKAIDDKPDEHGVLWGEAEFTEDALSLIAEKKYKYVSPVIGWGVRDHKGNAAGTALMSVALTNNPALQEMPAITLSEVGWVESSTQIHEEERAMVVKQLILTDRAASKANAVLEDGTIISLSVEGLEAPPKVLELTEIPRAKDGRWDFAKVMELSENDLVSLDVLRAMRIQDELDAAMKDGKITGAQRPAMEKLALSDVEAFRGFIGAQRKQVDMTEHGFAGAGEATDIIALDNRIDVLVREKQTANQQMDYNIALRRVLSEHPDLAAAKQLAMRD